MEGGMEEEVHLNFYQMLIQKRCLGYEDAQIAKQENVPIAEMFDSQRDLDKAETVEEYAEVCGGAEVEYILFCLMRTPRGG